MPRRALLLGLLILGAVILLGGGVLWYAFSSSPKSDLAKPSVRSVVRPAAAPLGPGYVANTILADPFPDDPSLAATRVSVDLDQASVADALDEVASAAGGTSKPPKFGPSDWPEPQIDIHLKEQPWLEAFLQFQARASVTVTFAPGPELAAQYTPKKVLPGTWCVSGPFAFLVTAINHSTSIGPDAKPVPRFAGEPPAAVYVVINTIVEPKLHLLQYPGKLQLIEVTDEHGHSLIPTGEPTGSARFAKPLSSYFATINCPLVYPADQPGRRIARLKATAEAVVETKAEMMEVDNPMDEVPADKTVGGMTVSFGKLTWNTQTHWMTLDVTYHKGTVEAGAWAALCPALVKGRLNLIPAVKSRCAFEGFRSSSEVADPITVRYTIPSDNMQSATPPKFSKLTLELPTGVRQVTVPVEFKDLPLP